MNEKGYFISVGAGFHQLPLIHAAESLGYKIIATDKNDRSPGFVFANIKIIESITEYRKIYNTLSHFPLDYPIKGIATRSYGAAVYTSAFIAERLSLPYSKSDAIKLFQNKRTLKELLAREGIKTPTSYSWQTKVDYKNTIENISFPCILKSATKHGKVGIHMIQDKDELQKELKLISPDNESYLLEDWIEGNEITVAGMVQNGIFQLISISDKITTKEPPFLELSHRLPSILNHLAGEIIVICQNIIISTELSHGPIIAEFKVTNDGIIYLMEFMPEVGGEYLAESLIPVFYHFDYFKELVNLATGNKIPPKPNARHQNSLAQICFFQIPEGDDVYWGSEWNSKLSHCDIFLDKELLTPGSKSDTSSGNASRVRVIGAISSFFSNHEDFDHYLRDHLTFHNEAIALAN